MNNADVLQLFVDRYATTPAPAPSRELAARMEAGRIGSADDDRGAVVVPFVPRPRLRMRYLAAALVASFLAMSGLAVAGSLPDPLQRGAASVVSHLGIDLPSPDGGSSPADGGSGGHGTGGSSPNGSTRRGSGSGSGSGPSGSGSSSGSSSGAPAGSPTTTTVPQAGGDLGGIGSTPTTLPPTTLPPTTSPPVTLPPVTLPPPTLPPLTVPSLTVPTLPPVTWPPPLSVPPLSVPPLTLPSLSVPPLLPDR